MVRLVCERKMRIGGLLLRAGVPSEPMPESAARALIAAKPEKLARLWLAAGLLKIEPDDGRFTEMRVVRVDNEATPPEPADPVERAVQAIEHAESLMVGLSEEERRRLDRLMEERYRSRLAEGDGEGEGDGTDSSGAPDEGEPDGGDATEPQPMTPPSPSEGAAGATPPADPADTWGLASRDREGLRALARELGLAEKVDLRLGEERLREALGAAIAASLGAEG